MKNIITFLIVICATMSNTSYAQQVTFRDIKDNMKAVVSEEVAEVDDPQDVRHAHPEEFEMAVSTPHVKVIALGRCISKSVGYFKKSFLCATVEIMYDGTKVVQFPQMFPAKALVKWKKNKINALFIIALMLINNLLLLALKKKRVITILSVALYATSFGAFGLGMNVLLSSLATVLLVAIVAVVLVIVAEDIFIGRILRGEVSQYIWRYIVSGSIVFYLSMMYYIFIT